jgi:hypothetical protein
MAFSLAGDFTPSAVAACASFVQLQHPFAPALLIWPLHGKAIVSSRKLTEDDKLSAVADIDAIQSQLAKPMPCAKVIKALWSGVEALATSAGLVVSVREVAKLLTAAYAAGG